MTKIPTVSINGRPVPIEGERNVLELARKAGIDIPTFCYHSELSIYGACRLCLVDIEGRGIVASCSLPPEPGMVIRTHTAEIRDMRRITVELLLANHHQGCTTCSKGPDCKLLDLAHRLGVNQVRFKQAQNPVPVDDSNPALVRDPNKCVLCGDCVRVCAEVQGIGAIDFAHRGAAACVAPAFGHDLGRVECVFCGQCARVCPTGAIVPKAAIDTAWARLADPGKRVVAQIAPAVRVAAGEAFGLAAGEDVTGKIVAALKMLGFAAVFDTSFTADLTVIEEAAEFLRRHAAGEKLPQFTSCCPAWVKYCEQYYPELLPNLSSCRSPQAMFGSLAKEMLPGIMGVERDDIVVVSIMPCTAKKFEATRPELATAGVPDTDIVLTTQELVRMVQGAGIDFTGLQPESLDMPFGFKTGAGVIFGNSGGVSEAVLRCAYESVTGTPLPEVEFREVRGEEGRRDAVIRMGDTDLRVTVVHSLANAREIAEQVKAGTAEAQLVEVMACPGGCIGGAGQPLTFDPEVRRQRTRGLYNVDRNLQLHKSQENPFVKHCYQSTLGEVGGAKAHDLLHTHYQSRKRLENEEVSLVKAESPEAVKVTVCVGTSCFLRGAQELLRRLVHDLKDRELQHVVDVKATFCHERCDRGPTVTVNGTVLERCTFETARDTIQAAVDSMEETVASV